VESPLLQYLASLLALCLLWEGGGEGEYRIPFEFASVLTQRSPVPSAVSSKINDMELPCPRQNTMRFQCPVAELDITLGMKSDLALIRKTRSKIGLNSL
jgi:hypothetical protein